MMRIEKEDLKRADEPLFTYAMKVRMQDIDAAGVVYFSRFFDFAHQAYEEFLESIGSDLPGVLRRREWSAPLRHAEADFRAPLRHGDVFRLQLVLADVRETEITLGFRLVRDDGKICALIQTVHTFLDPHEFRRMPVPVDIVEALEPITRV